MVINIRESIDLLIIYMCAKVSIEVENNETTDDSLRYFGEGNW